MNIKLSCGDTVSLDELTRALEHAGHTNMTVYLTGNRQVSVTGTDLAQAMRMLERSVVRLALRAAGDHD